MATAAIPAISADGRFVAFFLGREPGPGRRPNGENGDVFVRDRETGKTERVSVSSSGAQANGDSALPSISADGRFVAFDVLRHEPGPGRHQRMSRRLRPRPPDRHDEAVSVELGRQARPTPIAAQPSISANGRFVAFESWATNLVPGDTNGVADVFVRDLKTDKTRRVSVSSGGAQANSYSFPSSISSAGASSPLRPSPPNLVHRRYERRRRHLPTRPAALALSRVSLAPPLREDQHLALASPRAASRSGAARAHAPALR